MMERQWRGLLFIGAVWASHAGANDFRAETRVNGLKQYTVDAYPATLRFTLTASNLDPALPSELLTVTAPVMKSCALAPSPPLVVPEGGHVTYQCEVELESHDACLTLGLHDANPLTPNHEVSFTSTFSLGWDMGASQAATNVLCLPQPSLPCDDTVYLSTAARTPDGRPAAPSRLYIFDPATGMLTRQGESALPYNALAYNHYDNFLYAIASDGVGAPRFIRVEAAGSAKVIAPLDTAAPRAAIWTAGAVLKDGAYVAFEHRTRRLIRVDPSTGETLSERVVTAPDGFQIADFALHPRDGQLYAFNNATQRLTAIDPLTGIATDHPAPARIDGRPPENAVMSAAVFTRDGELFLYGTHGPDTRRTTGFHAVDVTTGALTTLLSKQVPQLANGAMCGVYLWGTPLPQPMTRDRGFFGASESALLECLAYGPITLGALGEVSTLPGALGILWANPAIASNHARRTAEASLKVRTAREALTAVCNERVFNTRAPDLSALVNPASVESGRMEALRQRLERHNHSGKRTAIPLRKRIFAVDPLRAMERAEEPRF
ncbi:DUF6923 family protein [Corallococcus macrosporus]|uniref:DUF6923 domain-containing protein n=2 Tax=Myxococcaceae TaxID=31 RepID=A0A250K2L6_9BACT|nr:PQQ-binding-like beta-propeller repeat protein [Corallococcus macrosporus]AEI65089.1 hypothetical protein LILAB_15930 [Corallococcus macrosporus]ATB50198.1 hypothetical protein MYMAC_005853 [Corallococcus macrosporus DSM 14697]